ncbi:MAG: hypothetical protein F6J97_08505 [Leptolyngbya sp. SIO4C1]|nr:hypothetical protein [Leptolyngbya sp. SIO4C1]
MTRETGSPALPSLGVDILLVIVSGIAAYLFSSAIAMANTTDAIQVTLLSPPLWLVLATVLIGPVWFLLLDVVNLLNNRLMLPFAGSQRRAQRIYANRVHLFLLALYFNAILVALCWSAPAMPLFSKLFLSAVFAIAIYAMGQSIPSTKLSFVISGLLFVIVLVATQAFIIYKMQAEAEEAQQQLIEQLEGRPDEDEDEDDN